MQWTTHEVSNQVPELHDYNLYSCDSCLLYTSDAADD